MVVFTCNHCGESLQKPKVEKHYQFVCRRVKSLTCVDCFKDFKAEEYVIHTKCITEEERYSAKGTYQNGIVKKGEVRQESWVEMVRSILDQQVNMKSAHRTLFDLISNHSNIPRKRAKFINFIKSSTGGRTNIKDIEDVWNIIEKYKTEQQLITQVNSENREEKVSKNETNESLKRELDQDYNENREVPKKKKKKQNNVEESATELVPEENEHKKRKKHKSNEAPDEVTAADVTETLGLKTQESTKFNFKETILEVVTKKGAISLNKLQKKVLNAYLKTTGESECSPSVIKKFNKKLQKVPNLLINEGSITLADNS